MNDLPLTGRSLSNLVFLAPGVTNVDTTCRTDATGADAPDGNCAANNYITDSRLADSRLERDNPALKIADPNDLVDLG